MTLLHFSHLERVCNISERSEAPNNLFGMEIHILIWLLFDLVIHIFIIFFGELEREEKKGGLGGARPQY